MVENIMDMTLSQLQKLKEQLGLKWHPKTRKDILKRRIITYLKRKENLNFEKYDLKLIKTRNI